MDRALLWPLALMLAVLLACSMFAGTVAGLPTAPLPCPSCDVQHVGLGLLLHGHVGEGSGLVHVRGSPLAHTVNAREGHALLDNLHLEIGRHDPTVLGLHKTHGNGPGNIPAVHLGCVLRCRGIWHVDVTLERHTGAFRLRARHTAITPLVLHVA